MNTQRIPVKWPIMDDDDYLAAQAAALEACQARTLDRYRIALLRIAHWRLDSPEGQVYPLETVNYMRQIAVDAILEPLHRTD